MNNQLTREQLIALAVRKIKNLKSAITQSAFTNIRRGLEEDLQLAEIALLALQSFGNSEQLNSAKLKEPVSETNKPVCTCQSGDSSLRWPCPVHSGSAHDIHDGYVMVPIEPTMEMIKAAQEHHEGEFYLPVSLYRAMLSAAPKEVTQRQFQNDKSNIREVMDMSVRQRFKIE